MKKTVKILDVEYNIETTTQIYLYNKDLTEIPKEVNELVNLKELWLNDNRIKKIENLDNLVNLERLYLRNNEIERIEGLDNNKNLIKLWLEDNNIEMIENIHHLDKLEELYLFDPLNRENIEEVKCISIINDRKKKLERI